MKKRVLFIIPSLAGGGAEKVLLTLLNDLDLTRFDATVALFSARNDYPGKLRPGVELVYFEKRRPLDFLKIVVGLAAFIRRQRPDLICGFLYYANLIALVARVISLTRTPVIVTEHNHLDITIKHSRLQKLKRSLVKALYPQASKVVCVSRGILLNLEEQYGLGGELCQVIYNPFRIEDIKALAGEALPAPPVGHRRTVVSCGRLTTQKNYPMLLRAIKLVAERCDVSLVILGDGELRSELELAAQELGIGERVSFLGFKSNPFAFIRRSDLFVLSSHWEGFGNVIVEAMACGTPVISTDCPSGPNEIITPGVNGLLVPVDDEVALAQAIVKVLDDQPLADRLREKGSDRCQDFDTGIIIRQYEDLFLQVCRNR